MPMIYTLFKEYATKIHNAACAEGSADREVDATSRADSFAFEQRCLPD